MTTVHFSTVLMPTSELVGSAIADREKQFRDTLRKALEAQGLVVGEMFGLGLDRTFIEEQQPDGTLVGNPYITVTVGVDLHTDDTETVEDSCSTLDLPDFATTAWRFEDA